MEANHDGETPQPVAPKSSQLQVLRYIFGFCGVVAVLVLLIFIVDNYQDNHPSQQTPTGNTNNINYSGGQQQQNSGTLSDAPIFGETSNTSSLTPEEMKLANDSGVVYRDKPRRVYLGHNSYIRTNWCRGGVKYTLESDDSKVSGNTSPITFDGIYWITCDCDSALFQCSTSPLPKW